MAARKKVGGLTDSKRVKKEKENSAGSRARKVAESAGTVLKEAAVGIGKTAVSGATQAVNSVSNSITTGASQVRQATTNGIQARNAITGEQGYTGQYASGQMTRNTDVYGGLAFPEQDFNGMIPSDLLNPSIELQATEEQLTQGLSVYAGATRAQQLLQAGFKYLGEIGKTKQLYHKAEQSIIKASTEGVKVQQELINYDIENIKVDQKLERREQENEKLKQEQIKTLGARNETDQLRLKIEANELKRDAEIQNINAQTQNIIQKYLKDSIHQGI
ncbi:MAG: hypothetical protein HC874_23575 [Richelia sp. SL_2_1]|nr:hypothetical protein [Richelia sp. SL_2_1]